MAIFSRIAAAFIGGYLLANTLSALLFFAMVDHELINQPVDGVNRAAIISIGNGMAASLLVSFLIYALAAMWVFYAKSAGRAWLGILLPNTIGQAFIVYLMPAPALAFFLSMLPF